MKELLLTLLASLITFLGINSGNSVLGNKTDVVITVTPTVTQSPAPTFLPPPKVIATIDPDPPVHCKLSQECGGGTTPLKQSECASSTCCGFPGGKWVFYKDKNQCLKDQGQNSSSTNNYTPPNSVSTKIHCSYNGGSDYNFDFGELTYDECKVKTDAYRASKRVAIPTYSYQSSPVPTPPPQKSAEDIQKCKDAVREKYDNLIRGCYVRYQGSAANMCASGYQSQSGPEWTACEK